MPTNERAARVLADIDAYDVDQFGGGDGVATQLVRQLAEPRPMASCDATSAPRPVTGRPSLA